MKHDTASAALVHDVVVLVVNVAGDVLTVTQTDTTSHAKLPSGSVLQHERPIDAACRKLKEETGLSPLKIVRIRTERDGDTVTNIFKAITYAGKIEPHAAWSTVESLRKSQQFQLLDKLVRFL